MNSKRSFQREIEAMEIADLIHRKLSHIKAPEVESSLSQTEESRLEQWLVQYDPEGTIIRSLSSRSTDEDEILEMLTKSREADSLRRVLGKIRAARIQRITRYGVAASLLVGLGWLVWVGIGGQETNRMATEAVDLAPGRNRAMLVLPDGQQLDLREDNQALILSGSGFTYEDGSPVIEENGGAGPSETSVADTYASLITPKGGQYQLVLPDGSKVWLNAASHLRYPVHFDERERVVELEGEAYFEIKPAITATGQLIPFRVSTSDQQVEVTGTAFNVSAYTDDDETLTTLLEGSVQVQDEASGRRFKLLPGEQTRLASGTFIKQSVDAQQSIAWREGFFQFKRADIQTVMRQISRWYDVDVRYEGIPDDVRITGKAYRNANASQVLEILHHLDIPFRIAGNEIIITNREYKK